MMPKKNYAYVNNEMLVWARSTTPFHTTIDVQARTHINASKLNAWESGDDYPSITEAKKLAKLYKIPFAAFFMSAPPEREPRPYTDRRTIRGTIYYEDSYELWSEIGRIIGNREKIIELVDKDDEDETFEPIPSYDKNLNAEKIGDAIRKYLGVKLPIKNKAAYNQKSFNYYRAVLESKGILVSQITGVSLEEMKGISIYYDDYPIIAVNNKDYERAKTFSLMHELAHILRRSSSLCMIDFDERNDEEEKLCDRIAAEILMPRDSFTVIARTVFNRRNEWDEEGLRYIADKFGVSPFSVIRRLYELKIVSKSIYSFVYEEMSNHFKENQAEIDANNEGRQIMIPYYVRYLNKEGYLYTKTIMSSYSKGKISYGEMCHILNVNSLHINKMERAVLFV